MSKFLPALLGASLLLATFHSTAAPDPRLREVHYDAQAVVTVPVQRGVVTLIVLGEDETIQEVASGLGADCNRPEAVWCIAAQPGGRTLFVKPKSGAQAANTLAVVTNERIYAFQLQLIAERTGTQPVYRLVVKPPAPPPPIPIPAAAPAAPPDAATPVLPPQPAPQEVVTERLQAKPRVLNADYTLAEGEHSADIVPNLVYDDGRFTYLRFPGNREVPTVFHVLGDGQETVVNTRMEDDLLVVDRVSRHLVLRSGSAVVGLWNEAFDLEGLPPDEGTTVAGVRRQLKPTPGPGLSPSSAGAPP